MEDYKEKLRLAKEALDSGSYDKETIEYIFPELKESGGERIRKELISLVKNYGPQNANPELYQNMLAWLEKQGEQKPTDKVEPKFHEGDKLVSTNNLHLTYEVLEVGHINELNNPEYKVEIFTDGKAENPRNIRYMECYKVDKWAKLVEQKSAWSEEDEKAINDIMWIIEAYRENGFNETHIQTADSSENWLKSLKERYTWKPSDLPHWKKSTLPNDNTTGFNSDYFCYKGYNINYKELFEKLPKDD